jgi:hypothetical protein
VEGRTLFFVIMAIFVLSILVTPVLAFLTARRRPG